MAQLYQLVPLPQGIFSGMDLVTRAVVGLIYDRIRLSNYNLIGDATGQSWYDPVEQRVYCIFTHAEMAETIGVSERTIRRSLALLNEENLVWWRKATYKGANRYFLHECITDSLRSSSIRPNCPANPAKMAGL
jgi:hypothetical protein